MVSWDIFTRQEQGPGWYTDLTEQNVFFYALIGPTQLQRYSDSSMLEQTHERQFAIAQLGVRNGGFEADHMARMELAFQNINDRFATYPLEEPCRPSSPHVEDLMNFRIQSHSFSPLPTLDLEPQSEAASSAPRPMTPPRKSPRSALDLYELMNPDPQPASKSKRHLSDDSDDIPRIQFDVGRPGRHDIDSDSGPNNPPPITYTRAKQMLQEGGPVRTRRGIRMRRPRPVVRHRLRDDARDARQLEKDCQLLLNLSQNSPPQGL
ncbi:hypothetical protein G647_01719 [Cladophialophora carrionii CBS 160.54]|uniref:Uncharacterized protein n=1 Tax=Cladophialophora carrionii CBS 160.54 TaxID=1279043 RepID=V9DRH7_9EURO|nr:uncharacterized protein G647_01719 [Cladophialophora carrionii CBS 160.54]ETI29266.1 hypothetical protein G647_01719 [Cladophialophora carrionii CBS 160.54]